MLFYKDIVDNAETCPICGSATVVAERIRPVFAGWIYLIDACLTASMITCGVILLSAQIFVGSFNSWVIYGILIFSVVAGLVGAHFLAKRKLKLQLKDHGYKLAGAIFCKKCGNKHIVVSEIDAAANAVAAKEENAG